jgi:acyl carrier protein
MVNNGLGPIAAGLAGDTQRRVWDEGAWVELEQDIRAFVVENFLLGSENGLTSSQSLLEAGIVDSTGVLELVAFLERTYHLELADQDLVPDNLDSIDNMVRFVRGRQAAHRVA